MTVRWWATTSWSSRAIRRRSSVTACRAASSAYERCSLSAVPTSQGRVIIKDAKTTPHATPEAGTGRGTRAMAAATAPSEQPSAAADRRGGSRTATEYRATPTGTQDSSHPVNAMAKTAPARTVYRTRTGRLRRTATGSQTTAATAPAPQPPLRVSLAPNPKARNTAATVSTPCHCPSRRRLATSGRDSPSPMPATLSTQAPGACQPGGRHLLG